jgi:hypothetical protein
VRPRFSSVYKINGIHCITIISILIFKIHKTGKHCYVLLYDHSDKDKKSHLPLPFGILFRSTTITTTTPIIKAATTIPVPAATAITELLSLALSEIRGHFIFQS